MIADLALRVFVTILFVLAGCYCASRLTRRISVPARGTYVAHLLMSVAMIAMAWPGGVGLLPVPQLVVFGAATAWFLVLALSFGRAWSTATHHELHGRLVYWYHAVMMASMVWMLAVMDAGRLGGPPASAHSHGAGHVDGGSMAGMDMSSFRGDSAVVVVAWGLGLMFCIAALAWLGVLVPERRTRPSSAAALSTTVGTLRAEVGYETVMAVGMAIMAFAFL